MSFNINRFKSTVFSDKYGGLARTNLFDIKLSKTDSAGVGNDLSFFCSTVTLPGINLSTYEYRPDSIGLGQMIPTGIQYSSLSTIIMLDDNHKILNFFHSWMQSVYNYNAEDKLAPRAGDARHFPHELGYKEDYSCIMDIRHFSAHNKNGYYNCKLSGVYPYEIAPVDLSWSNDAQIATVAVQFSYSKILMQGAVAGPIPDYYTTDGNISQSNLSRDNEALKSRNSKVAENLSYNNFMKKG